MNRDSCDNKWFALWVRSGKEKQVCRTVRAKGYSVLLPLTTSRQLSSAAPREVSSALFPGYLFCQLNLMDTRMPLLTTPDVLGLVGFRSGPIPLEDHEVLALRRIAECGLPAHPFPFVPAGCEVRLLAGPLSGLRGTVVEHHKSSHLIVSVQLLQRSISVEIQHEWAYARVA
jgi:transcription antitermination factor NusG